MAMTTRVTKRIGTTITVESTIEIGGPILKAEEAIQVAVNEVGAAATVEALKQFDADGEPLMIGGEVSKLLVQELGAYASAVVQAKEETWTYATPQVEAEIAAVGIGTDGSCLVMCEGQ
jgi:hypothetical protein